MSNREPSLLRRLYPALALTGVGFGLINVLDRPAPTGAAGAGMLDTTGAGQNTVATGDGAVVTTVPTPNSVAAQSQGTAPATPATQAPAATAAPATPATQAPAATAAPATDDCGAVAKTGNSVEITWRRSYGVVQVTVKATSSGQVCGATAQYQTYDSKSARYEDYAVPILNQQVASAHGANIQGVSGATAVSQAYQQSLQSAIDQI
ncbi:MAG: hypothetical protein RLZZ526_1647 [Actinomycetota bacterium]|jgi:uncharacterized protein with FMN-binding domain